MLFYNQCASIQTANRFLSETTIEFYSILRPVYIANMNDAEDQSSEASETIIGHDEAKEWCIL